MGTPARVVSILLAACLGATSLGASASVAAIGDAPSGGPEVAAAATDGPLLYMREGAPTTIGLSGAPTRRLPGSTFGAAAFSPDGARAVGTVPGCAVAQRPCPDSKVTSRILVVKADGTRKNVAAIVGNAQSLTWSPDARQVAILVSLSDWRGAIYRVPLDGSRPTQLIRGNSAFGVDVSWPNAISWNPVDDRIAFVGSDNRDFISEQLYTVEAGGGPAEPYNRYDVDEEQGFAVPAWSPDGTLLAAYGSDLDGGSLRLVEEGSVSGTELVRIPSVRGAATYHGEIAWSADGERILYSVQTKNFTKVVARLAQVADGSTTRVAAPGHYMDWQPCPTGRCVTWRARKG